MLRRFLAVVGNGDRMGARHAHSQVAQHTYVIILSKYRTSLPIASPLPPRTQPHSSGTLSCILIRDGLRVSGNVNLWQESEEAEGGHVVSAARD